LPIRWRLTLFIALAIGAILLVLGVVLFILVSEALLSTVEDTAEKRTEEAADIIRSGQTLQDEDVQELTLDGVFVIIRNGEGDVLYDPLNLTSEGGAEDRVWKKTLETHHHASGRVEFSGGVPDYIYAVRARTPQGRARVVERESPTSRRWRMSGRSVRSSPQASAGPSSFPSPAPTY
jgi:hypothetical protein